MQLPIYPRGLWCTVLLGNPVQFAQLLEYQCEVGVRCSDKSLFVVGGDQLVTLGREFGELKRMYVSPRARGQGVAKKLLARLESEAIGAGCQWLNLETGPYQPEALALYASTGYARRGPFGDYKSDPLSVFMQKHLAA